MFSVEDPNASGGPITTTDGRLFAVSISIPPIIFTNGQDPALAGIDAEFRPGANGFLLATVDFDIVGDGTADFDFIPGSLGVVNDGVGQVPVTFGSGRLETFLPCLAIYCDPYYQDPYYQDPYFYPEPEPEPTIDAPEPSSAILLILGAAGGMVARRRRS